MGPRKNDMEKDPHVLDGDFGGFQNGASYVDLQVFYAHQLDFTTGKQPNFWVILLIFNHFIVLIFFAKFSILLENLKISLGVLRQQ